MANPKPPVKQSGRGKTEKPHRTLGKTLFALVTGIVALIYLINPTAGFIELIPDALPVIGNLDEAGATLLLLGCLRYFGLDVTSLFDR